MGLIQSNKACVSMTAIVILLYYIRHKFNRYLRNNESKQKLNIFDNYKQKVVFFFFCSNET